MLLLLLLSLVVEAAGSCDCVDPDFNYFKATVRYVL